MSHPHTIKRRRMFHDRDERGQNYLTCLAHGRQAAVSQEEAERGHAEGRKCPACDAEMRTLHLRKD